jgi:large subunit ribosomal protein L25
MSNQLSLEKRVATGKQLKSLRAEGQIPSVVYGGEAPVLTTSSYNATEKVLNEAGYHSPIQLDLAGKAQLAIVKNIDIDPVSRRIINVEFQAVSADEIVEAITPITIVNFEASEASKKHYVILQVMEDVEVKAQPTNLPQEIIVDGSKLAELDDKLTLADLQLPEGVALADKELAETTVIANVYDPAAEAAAREAEDAVAKAADASAEAAPAADAEAKAE